jgi:hypothetical protein
MKLQLLRWKQSKTRNLGARHKIRASLISDKGLDAANHNRASGAGRRMFLTSPLIEQGLTVKFRLLSIRFTSVSLDDERYGDFAPIESPLKILRSQNT